MEFDLGVGKKNYFRYNKDEDVAAEHGTGIIETNFSFTDEVEIVKQSKFHAAEDVPVSILKRNSINNYVQEQFNVLQCLAHKQSDGVWTTDNSPKLKIGYKENIGKTLNIMYNNADGSDNGDYYTYKYATSNNLLFSGETEGYGVNYHSDLCEAFYYGYASIIESGKKLPLTFRLSAIDLHGFSYKIPIWLSQFNKYFFVKKISNWDEGKDCEIELIQLP
jgi:hypothetical protein